MASLRLKFPEKEEPSLVVLTGARVTLGRLPLNTIQIIDRTLSGFHAEFVLEDDHYRLHDRGSTNGTFVNGEAITDFHLRESCKISFGALECEFSPEAAAPAEGTNIEALPTRSEINAVRQENAELKNRVDSLREEMEALHKTRSADTGTNTVAVDKSEFEKVVAERETLKESQHGLHQEITRLKTDLALLQRDRENLKKVAETAKAEFATLRAEPISPAPAEEAPEPAKAPEPPIEPAAAEPIAAETAAAPAETPAAMPKPSFPLPSAPKLPPKPPGPLGAPGKLPVAPAATPAAGVKPVAVPTPVAKPAAPAPAMGLKPLLRPLPKAPVPVQKGSTQKLDADAVQPVKPVAPAPKGGPLKPPVKLPLQPTVKLQRPAAPLKTGSNAGEENAEE